MFISPSLFLLRSAVKTRIYLSQCRLESCAWIQGLFGLLLISAAAIALPVLMTHDFAEVVAARIISIREHLQAKFLPADGARAFDVFNFWCGFHLFFQYYYLSDIFRLTCQNQNSNFSFSLP